MRQEEILDAIHAGIYESNEIYKKWSNGYFVNGEGIEHFMVTQIAHKIMSLENKPNYLRLECPVGEMRKNWELSFQKGRKNKDEVTDNSRIDIALLNSDYKIKFAIEAKSSYAFHDGITKDIVRLAGLHNLFGKNTDDNNVMVSGILALFISSYSKKSKEEATNNLEKHIDVFKEKLLKSRDEINSNKRLNVDVKFHLSSEKKNIYEYKDESEYYYHIGTSLCVIVRSK